MRIDTKSSKSSHLHFDHHFDGFDILPKLIWYILIIRIFIQRVLFFLSTQPGHRNKVVQQAVP